MAFENPFKGMSKPMIYASLAGFLGITGFLAYRHHRSTGSWNPFNSAGASSPASATTSTTMIDPVTGLPYSQDDATDPLTGLQYLAEAEQYGSVQAAEASVSQFGSSVPTGSGVGVQPAVQANGTVPGSTNPPGSPYTSNAGWAQAVQAGLVDIGYDSQAVAAALGLYLTGEPLTSAQAQIVNTAIAEFGAPPVGNLQVTLQPPSQPAAPKVPGTPVLSVTPYVGFADFGWSVPAGATSYELVVTGAGGTGTGTSHFDQTVTNNHVEKLSLQPGKYVAYVRAENSAGASPYSAHKAFTIPTHVGKA